MKVRLITEQTVNKYAKKLADSVSSFSRWIARLENADWETVNDIVSLSSADLLGQGTNRVIFNVGGNNYRILCKYRFGKNMVHIFVLWLRTHAEYDKLCTKNKQYTIEKY